MKKLIFNNLGLKIASVLLAIVLWIFVTSRGQSEISIEVPLEFKNIPQGLELTSYSVRTVSLNIRGQERLLKNIKPSDIRPYVDLSRARKGESIHYINKEDIKVPPSITITNVNPTSIKVFAEETISKRVKVIPVITGEPARGYYIKSVEVIPQYITINGIKSEVLKIGTVKTEPYDITGMSDPFTQELKIDLTGRNIKPEPREVTLKVIISER